MKDSRQQDFDLGPSRGNESDGGQKPASLDSRVALLEQLLTQVLRELVEASVDADHKAPLLAALAQLTKQKKWRRFRHSTGEELPDDGVPL